MKKYLLSMGKTPINEHQQPALSNKKVINLLMQMEDPHCQSMNILVQLAALQHQRSAL
jgi:hypothetical protein